MIDVQTFISQHVIGGIGGAGTFPQSIKVTDEDWLRLARELHPFVAIGTPPKINLLGGAVEILPTTSTAPGRAALLDLSGSSIL